MIDYLFFGQAKKDRAQLRAMDHFLGKRIRYGRDILPSALLLRLQEARGHQMLTLSTVAKLTQSRCGI